jgi:hypothetical protein
VPTRLQRQAVEPETDNVIVLDEHRAVAASAWEAFRRGDRHAMTLTTIATLNGFGFTDFAVAR